MASGIARGRVRTTATTTESRNMTAILQIIGWQRHAALVYRVLWYWTSMLWSIATCPKVKVSADQYHVTISRAQVYSFAADLCRPLERQEISWPRRNLTLPNDMTANKRWYVTNYALWQGQNHQYSLHSDDDRIVSHDAIFYVRDATSKLSWISAWKNVVFSAVYFLFLLQ